jgi:lipopolysaccharide biosynthesis glycosyltransferase
MGKAVFIFTPSHMQQQYLEFVFDSIAKNITIPYQFCLFTDKVRSDFKSKHDVVIRTVSEVDHQKLKDLYYKEGRGDIPAFSAYAQLIMPRYFSEYKSFIYMEVDQIVRGDLAPLWFECNKSGAVLAAARFLDDDFATTTVESFNRVNPKAKCYNTGVLYVDIANWIVNGFEEKCFEELILQKKYLGKRLDFYAQGAINNALHYYILEIDAIYNLPGFGSVRGISEDVISKAKILHWTGPKKAWSKNGLYKDLYYFDESLRDNSDYKLTFPLVSSLKIKFKRMVRGILRFIRFHVGVR